MIPSITIPTSRRLRRFMIRLALAVSLMVLIVPGLAAFVTVAALVYTPCSESSQTPADFSLPYESLTLPASAGGSMRAYLIPGGSAAVIIPPALASGRGNHLAEGAVLARHGYTVLLYESRRCAGMGNISLGYEEIQEVGDALAYLQGHPDIDPERIGVLGFSSAGATAIMAAARYPALRAVIAEGGYGDLAEGQIGLDQGGPLLELLFRQGLRLSYRVLTGSRIEQLSPEDVIGRIAPRPVLLVYGSRESSLPGARKQLAAAGENAALWVVDGAGHGDYLYVAPDEYARRITTFLDNALQGTR